MLCAVLAVEHGLMVWRLNTLSYNKGPDLTLLNLLFSFLLPFLHYHYLALIPASLQFYLYLATTLFLFSHKLQLSTCCPPPPLKPKGLGLFRFPTRWYSAKARWPLEEYVQELSMWGDSRAVGKLGLQDC